MQSMDQTDQPGGVPAGYEQVLYWTVTGKTARLVALQIVGIILFVLFGVLFIWLALRVGDMPRNFTLFLGPSQVLALLLGGGLTLVLHELVHGFFMRLHGARPKYGAMWKQAMFYATSPGFAYPRNGYLVIALAPLVVMSVLAVILMALLKGTDWVVLLALLGAINASGAVGDMWISSIVMRYPSSARVMDEKDGMKIWMPVKRNGEFPQF